MDIKLHDMALFITITAILVLLPNSIHGVEFPFCETDKDCGEWRKCVDGFCNECHIDTDCPQDMGFYCKDGSCRNDKLRAEANCIQSTGNMELCYQIYNNEKLYNIENFILVCIIIVLLFIIVMILYKKIKNMMR